MGHGGGLDLQCELGTCALERMNDAERLGRRSPPSSSLSRRHALGGEPDLATRYRDEDLHDGRSDLFGTRGRRQLWCARSRRFPCSVLLWLGPARWPGVTADGGKTRFGYPRRLRGSNRRRRPTSRGANTQLRSGAVAVAGLRVPIFRLPTTPTLRRCWRAAEQLLRRPATPPSYALAMATARALLQR